MYVYGELRICLTHANTTEVTESKDIAPMLRGTATVAGKVESAATTWEFLSLSIRPVRSAQCKCAAVA